MISTALHREALSRASRWKLVVLGGVIGSLLTWSATFALARIDRELARGHHDAVVQQPYRAAHTSCLRMLSDARHFTTVPTIEHRAACVRAPRSTR